MKDKILFWVCIIIMAIVVIYLLTENNSISLKLAQQRKSLILILVNQRQNFVWVCIIMMAIVICLLRENNSISLKPIIMSTFQLNFG